ncbi:hypothetical protein KY330_02995 [Candidatus Woesearchaeota archaeon]|nr:hypothetical protein [Candidatus Woesearchaeota archaeon]
MASIQEKGLEKTVTELYRKGILIDYDEAFKFYWSRLDQLVRTSQTFLFNLYLHKFQPSEEFNAFNYVIKRSVQEMFLATGMLDYNPHKPSTWRNKLDSPYHRQEFYLKWNLDLRTIKKLENQIRKKPTGLVMDIKVKFPETIIVDYYLFEKFALLNMGIETCQVDEFAFKGEYLGNHQYELSSSYHMNNGHELIDLKANTLLRPAQHVMLKGKKDELYLLKRIRSHRPKGYGKLQGHVNKCILPLSRKIKRELQVYCSDNNINNRLVLANYFYDLRNILIETIGRITGNNPINKNDLITLSSEEKAVFYDSLSEISGLVRKANDKPERYANLRGCMISFVTNCMNLACLLNSIPEPIYTRPKKNHILPKTERSTDVPYLRLIK